MIKNLLMSGEAPARSSLGRSLRPDRPRFWSEAQGKRTGMQVEARLRQLEGKALSSGAAQLGQKANQAVYNPQAQGVSAAIATTSKSYNPGADVTMNGSLEKKEKASWFFPSLAVSTSWKEEVCSCGSSKDWYEWYFRPHCHCSGCLM